MRRVFLLLCLNTPADVKAASLPSMARLFFKTYFYNIVPKWVWFVIEMYYVNDMRVLKR